MNIKSIAKYELPIIKSNVFSGHIIIKTIILAKYIIFAKSLILAKSHII